jgi:DNA-binding MarR family transcriptional regulator
MYSYVTVQHEPWRRQIAQTTAQCALANLRRAARAATRLYDEALAPSGLRSTQFTVLATVAAAATLSVTELAASLGMDRTTLARNLGPLERDGLLSIERGSDQRVRLVSLTDAGLKRLRAAAPLRARAQRRVLGTLGAETYRTLLGTLDTIARAAEG